MPSEPTPDPGLDTWRNRYAAALTAHAEARRRAWEARAMGRADDALDRAELDALGRVHQVEAAAVGDFLFLLRKAEESAELPLVKIVAKAVEDLVDKRMGPVRADLVELAEKVVELEERSGRGAYR